MLTSPTSSPESAKARNSMRLLLWAMLRSPCCSFPTSLGKSAANCISTPKTGGSSTIRKRRRCGAANTRRAGRRIYKGCNQFLSGRQNFGMSHKTPVVRRSERCYEKSVDPSQIHWLRRGRGGACGFQQRLCAGKGAATRGPCVAHSVGPGQLHLPQLHPRADCRLHEAAECARPERQGRQRS